MKKQDVLQILREVERGSVSAEEAFTRLKLAPFEDIGFAKVDHHREMRQGVAEVKMCIRDRPCISALLSTTPW